MKKSPEQIVDDIQQACKLLGWNIAMDESKEGVRGLVIGLSSYVEDVVTNLPDKDNYSIYAPAVSAEGVH